MKYLSLFSGIGGFEVGLQNSKYNDKLECIGFSEVDKYATSIYKRHFSKHKELGDVTKINTRELPDFDLLVGGFPCQAFSIAGKRRGFEDTRGTLFFEIARILKDKAPRYVLLKNVKGLLSHDKGKTFQKILEVLDELGYDVEWKIYNSKNYGVPQNRERVFIKGHFRTECRGEIFSIRGAGSEVDGKVNVKDGGFGKSFTYLDSGDLSHTLRADSNGNGGRTFVDHPNDIKLIKYNNQGSRIYDSEGIAICLNASSTENYKVNHPIKLNDKAQAQTVYSVDGVSCTLSANGGGQGGKTGLYKIDEPKVEVVGNFSPSNHHEKNVYNTDGLSPTLCSGSLYKNGLNILEKEESNDKAIPVLTPNRLNKNQNGKRFKKDGDPSYTLTCNDVQGVLDGYRIRRLTPLECERLQGFPDNWTKYGTNDEPISDTQRYKCCGNAVTTNVITHIFNNWNLKGD